MNIGNIQSLAAIVNMIDTLAKSDEEAQILSVSISRFNSPTIHLSYEFFKELFNEYEIKESQGSLNPCVITYVNGVEICAIVPNT